MNVFEWVFLGSVAVFPVIEFIIFYRCYLNPDEWF